MVTDNCEHAFWEECEDQTKKVPFHVSLSIFSPPSLAFTCFHPPDNGVAVLEGQGDLVREVQGSRQANQHDVLVLCGKQSSKKWILRLISFKNYNLSGTVWARRSKVEITQADAVPKCDTVEVEKQIEVFLLKIDFNWILYVSMLIFTAISVFQCAAQVMEKSCQPQTEQMCNPPKKQPTQEKVHQVGNDLKD